MAKQPEDMDFSQLAANYPTEAAKFANWVRAFASTTDPDAWRFRETYPLIAIPPDDKDSRALFHEDTWYWDVR